MSIGAARKGPCCCSASSTHSRGTRRRTAPEAMRAAQAQPDAVRPDVPSDVVAHGERDELAREGKVREIGLVRQEMEADERDADAPMNFLGQLVLEQLQKRERYQDEDSVGLEVPHVLAAQPVGQRKEGRGHGRNPRPNGHEHGEVDGGQQDAMEKQGQENLHDAAHTLAECRASAKEKVPGYEHEDEVAAVAKVTVAEIHDDRQLLDMLGGIVDYVIVVGVRRKAVRQRYKGVWGFSSKVME